MEMIEGDVAEPERDLLRARHPHALALLEDLDEMAGLDQGSVRAGVEPGEAAAQDFDMEVAPLEIDAVDVGNLELAARRRLQRGGDLYHVVVVEVEAGYGEIRLRMSGLLFDGDGAPPAIQLDDPVGFRRAHGIAEDGCAGAAQAGARQRLGQGVAVEDMVAEDESHPVGADEIGADDEGIGKPARLR